MINGAHALIGYPAGILADRIGKEIVLSISYGVFLVSAVIMLLSPSSAHAYVIAAVFSVYIGIAETVQKTVVSKYVANYLHGTAYGLYNMVIGFSFLGGNPVFGLMLDSSGIAAATTYRIVMSFIAIAAPFGFQAMTRPRAT